jgi:hypothetical protein
MKYYGDEVGNSLPADLEKTNAAAASSAASTSKDSYTEKITLRLVNNKQYKFWFKYKYEDPETKEIVLSDSSPIWTESFTVPNLTRAVKNLTLTAGSQSYGVKFDLDPLSVQEDVVIFESLTSDFATQTIVYTGTSTNVSILTTGPNAFANRWVKVRSRDKWDDLNISEATAGPIKPFTSDPDTTYTVENPGSSSATASIDPKDLSGFSLVSTISWAQSTNVKTAGYAIRWSTDNPSTVATPLWEYASVSGIATTSFTATGLIPNTTYYYQVASTTPYDVVNWTGAASGTFIASDADGTAAGALARLKSFIAIGGASQDLFKIGTGITQGINLSVDPIVSPTLTQGTYHGIILNKSTTNVGNNFWLTTGQFRVGNPTEFMYWNGTNLYLTGSINATGGKFTGNVQLAIPPLATTSGVLYAGANPTSGARVRFSSEGIFAYDNTSTSNETGQTFSLVQSTGRLNAELGTVGGWSLAKTSLSSSNTKIENSGNITLGNQVGSIYPIIRLSADDPTYRLWIGSNSGSTAPFRVTKEGILYASAAVIGLAAGSTIEGYATSDQLTATNNNLATTNSNISGFSSTITALNNRVGTVETNKANSSDVNTALGLKANSFDVNTALGLKANLSALDAKLDTNAFSVLAVAERINLIDPNVVTIDGGKLTAGSVDTLQLAVGAVTAVEIAAGTITADEIAAGAITAEKIEAGAITAGKIAATQTLSGHTIVGNRIATSSSSTRVELVNNTVDSLRAIISGSTVGHVLGYGTAAQGGMVMHYGSTANPDVTSGHVRVQSNYAILVGTASNYVEADSNSIYLRNGSGGVLANLNTLASGASNVRYTGTQFYAVTSTRDSKTNIQDISFTDNQIKSLRPRVFQGKEDIKWGMEQYGLGLIAEEVAEIEGLETLIDKDKDGNLVGVNYDRISVALIDVLKRVLDRLDALES